MTITYKHKRPTDINQRAKLIVDIATGGVEEEKDARNPAAVALGRLGGLKGGKARAEKLTVERRGEIAKESGCQEVGEGLIINRFVHCSIFCILGFYQAKLFLILYPKTYQENKLKFSYLHKNLTINILLLFQLGGFLHYFS